MMKQGRALLYVPRTSGVMIALLLGMLIPSLGAGDGGAATGVRRWFSDLSDDEPVIREEARQRLMSLTRQDLPALRQVVKEHLPLMPAESQVLHEIVTQVYLAEESYESDESLGFLGVVFDIEQRFEELPLGGVEIRHRIPGFCASRWLEDGDIILSVGDPPAALLHTDEDVRRAVQRHSARRRVEFEVLRRGRLLRVPIVLDAKPNDLQDGGTTTIADFMAPRQQSAQEYWEAQFQALVEE